MDPVPAHPTSLSLLPPFILRLLISSSWASHRPRIRIFFTLPPNLAFSYLGFSIQSLDLSSWMSIFKFQHGHCENVHIGCERWSLHRELRCFAFERILVFSPANCYEGGGLSSDNVSEITYSRARLACDNKLLASRAIQSDKCIVGSFFTVVLIGICGFQTEGLAIEIWYLTCRYCSIYWDLWGLSESPISSNWS